MSYFNMKDWMERNKDFTPEPVGPETIEIPPAPARPPQVKEVFDEAAEQWVSEDIMEFRTQLRENIEQEAIWPSRPLNRARATDPDTSHEAAAKSNAWANEIDRKILSCLRDNPEGRTSLEISELTGLGYVSVSPSMVLLERAGYIRREGKRRNPTGMKAICWKLN